MIGNFLLQVHWIKSYTHVYQKPCLNRHAFYGSKMRHDLRFVYFFNLFDENKQSTLKKRKLYCYFDKGLNGKHNQTICLHTEAIWIYLCTISYKERNFKCLAKKQTIYHFICFCKDIGITDISWNRLYMIPLI